MPIDDEYEHVRVNGNSIRPNASRVESVSGLPVIEHGGHWYVWHPAAVWDTERKAEKVASITGTAQEVHFHRQGAPCSEATCQMVGPDRKWRRAIGYG